MNKKEKNMRKSSSPYQVSPTNNAKRNSRTSTASTLTGTFTSTSQIYGKGNGGVLYKAKPTPQKKKEWDVSELIQKLFINDEDRIQYTT